MRNGHVAFGERIIIHILRIFKFADQIQATARVR
jgi:hypothetical protein